MSIEENQAQPSDIQEVIEDHALEVVPLDKRRSGWSLAWSTTGIVTTLVQLLIGSYVTAVAGVILGIIAGILVGAFGATLGWLVGHVAHKGGLSSTVTARFYGFGVKGSVIASGIFGFMILGFLALENALLYNGTLFAFGMKPSVVNAVVIYGILTILWIVLTTFGIGLVTRVSSILVVAFLVLLAYMIWDVAANSGVSLQKTLSSGPLIPGLGSELARFQIVLVALAGSAGALALVDADYARFARTTRDVGILAIAGAIAIDVLVVVTGTIIVHGSVPLVAKYLVAHGQASSAATAAQKANALAQANTGAYFIILSSIAGFILMYAAQAKAQVLNTYSGSLALSNFFDVLFGWRPGRLFMVILGNIIGLAMVAGGILGLLQAWLGVLGILTTSFCGVVIADYYVIRGRSPVRGSETIDVVNWAGVVSIVVAATVSTILQEFKLFNLGFLLALVITLILYPMLRQWVLKPGTFTGQAPATLVADEGGGSHESIREAAPEISEEQK